MKRPLLLSLAALALVLFAGCGHMDLSPETDPNRILTGTVNVRMSLIPPPDAQVVVRVVAPPDLTSAPTTATNDLVIGERGTREQPEQVLAEQVIRTPGALPVPFRVEFRAPDEQLRRGLNVEARISWGGRLRFRNLDAIAITLANVSQPQTIWVQPVER